MSLSSYNSCPTIVPDHTCLLYNLRALCRILAGTNIFCLSYIVSSMIPKLTKKFEWLSFVKISCWLWQTIERRILFHSPDGTKLEKNDQSTLPTKNQHQSNFADRFWPPKSFKFLIKRNWPNVDWILEQITKSFYASQSRKCRAFFLASVSLFQIKK